jgi:hypothetical protein
MNNPMNVGNYVFYKNLCAFLPFGPTFCGAQGFFIRFLRRRPNISEPFHRCSTSGSWLWCSRWAGTNLIKPWR